MSTTNQGTNSLNDRECLVEFTQNGSDKAFELLMQRHSKMVFAASMRILNDSHLAEDVTQAVFILLMQKAESLSPKVKIPGWLYNCSVNLSMNQMASRRSKQKTETNALEVYMTNQDPSRDKLWLDIRPQLDIAVNKLPERLRETMILCFFEGKSNKEAATILGCTEDSIRVYTSRALEKIRKFMRGKGLATTSSALSAVLSVQVLELKSFEIDMNTIVSLANDVNSRPVKLIEYTSKKLFIKKIKITATILLVLSGSAYFIIAKMMIPDSSPETMASVDIPPEKPIRALKKVNITKESSWAKDFNSFFEYKLALFNAWCIEGPNKSYQALRKLGIKISNEGYQKISQKKRLLKESINKKLKEKTLYHSPENIFKRTLQREFFKNLVVDSSDFGELFYQWFLENPEAISIWAYKLPEIGPLDSNAFFRTVIKYWILNDPDQAERFIKKQSPILSDHWKNHCQFLLRIRKDPESMISESLKLTDQMKIFQHWVFFDSKGAFSWLRRQADRSILCILAFQENLHTLTSRHQEEFVSWLEQIPGNTQAQQNIKISAKFNLLSLLVEQDLSSTTDQLIDLSIQYPFARFNIYDAHLQHIVYHFIKQDQKNLDRMRSFVDSFSNEHHRNCIFGALINSLLLLDQPKAVSELIKNRKSIFSDQTISILMNALDYESSLKILEHQLSISEKPATELARIRQILLILSLRKCMRSGNKIELNTHQKKQLKTYIAKFTPEENQRFFIYLSQEHGVFQVRMFLEYLRSNPPSAITSLRSSNWDKRCSLDVKKSIIQSCSRLLPPNQVMELIQSVSSESEQNPLLELFLHNIIHNDPRWAEKYLIEEFNNINYHGLQDSYIKLGRSFARKDIDEAKKWVENMRRISYPQEDRRETDDSLFNNNKAWSAAGVYKESYRKNPQKAIEWLSEIELSQEDFDYISKRKYHSRNKRAFFYELK